MKKFFTAIFAIVLVISAFGQVSRPGGGGGGVVNNYFAPGGIEGITIVASNGTSTSYGALQAALNVLTNNDTLYLGPGVTNVNGVNMPFSFATEAPVFIFGKTNVTIESHGFIINGQTWGTIIHMTSCSNITLRGLKVLGTMRDQTVAEPVEHNYGALLMQTNQMVRIYDCEFVNHNRQGITSLVPAYETTDVIIQNCYFENIGSTNVTGNLIDGAAISGMRSNYRVINNTARKVAHSFVEIEGANYPDKLYTNILVQGNHVLGFGRAGIMMSAANGTNISEINILDNHLVSQTSDFFPSIINTLGIEVRGGRRVNISRNQIVGYGGSQSVGIFVESLYGPTADFNFSENHVFNWNQGISINDGNSAGLTLSNFRITGNHMRYLDNQGIYVDGRDGIINDNYITGAGRLSGSGGAIEVRMGSANNPTNILISGNVIADLPGTATTDDGIWIENGAKFITLSRNLIRNAALEPINNDVSWEVVYVDQSLTSTNRRTFSTQLDTQPAMNWLAFNSFKLTNYVLGTTNLLSGTTDASGCAYYPSNNTWFTIRNNAPRDIREFDMEGNLIRTITTTGLTDPEGICWMYGNRFAVIDEDTAQILMWNIETNTTTLNTNTATILGTGLPVDVSATQGGLEGITYDSRREMFYLCRENGNPIVYSCTASGVTGAVWTASVYTAITNGIAAGAVQFDFSDLYYEPNSDSIFLLSHTATNVTQITMSGSVVGRRRLAAVTGANMFTQAEGICLTPNGKQMLVVGEAAQYSLFHEWEATLPLRPNSTNNTLQLRAYSVGTPGTPGTVAHWMQFQLNGTNCWLPLYQ